MKFTVDRKTWVRGLKPGIVTKLLNKHGRCCIGFVCQQLGATDDELRDKGRISDLAPGVKLRIGSGLDGGFTWIGEAYHINDDYKITDAEREKRLSELFAANGHEMEFIN